MSRTIEIIIGTTGEIQIDAVGFKGPDCEQATKFLEEALGVAQAVQALPDHQREAVSLYYWQGCTLAEIGENLGCSTSAAGGLLRRGLEKLRQRFPIPE